jgi:hypothetical protein
LENRQMNEIEMQALLAVGGTFNIPAADVHAAVAELGAAIEQAGAGMGQRAAFEKVGVDVERLLPLSPVERFSQVAAAIQDRLPPMNLDRATVDQVVAESPCGPSERMMEHWSALAAENPALVARAELSVALSKAILGDKALPVIAFFNMDRAVFANILKLAVEGKLGNQTRRPDKPLQSH